MSLQYIIDGCNIINHPQFIQHTTKLTKHPKAALLELIKEHKLCGSPKNKVVVVFDGYPGRSFENMESDIDVVFSKDLTADEKIKKIIENSASAKNIIVVSDDKEIKLSARFCRAKAIGVAEFIPEKQKRSKVQDESVKAELSYTQVDKINKELKKIWLK